jgi:hypothetical protein
LATSVDKIEFRSFFNASYANYGSAYRELDVFGQATLVPEPSVVLLLAAGVCLVWQQWKNAGYTHR